ncbi:MAG: hypothetical protein ABIZ04_25715 [Opitutus sp.]
MSFLRLLRAHLDWFSRASKLKFFLTALIELVALSYGVGMILQVVFAFPPRADLSALSPVALIVLTTLVSPLVETVLFQFVPIAVVSALGGSRRAQFIAAVGPFAFAHFVRVDVPTGICAGLIGGAFFAATYLRWARASDLTAVLLTTALHSGYNLVGVGLLLTGLAGDVGPAKP